MARFDAVIFDLFGTLVPKWSHARALASNATIARMLGVEPDRFQSAWDATFHDREQGRHPSVEAAIRHILPGLGVEADDQTLRDIENLRRVLHEQRIRPRDDVDPTLEALAGDGVEIGLLSNISPPGSDVFRSLAVCRHFHGLAFSCDEGMEKPDPAFYELILSRLSTPAERCLFVGDGGNRELTGARRAGMHPVLIRVDHEIAADGWQEDAAEWDGPTIGTIAEVLDLRDRGER